MNNGLKLTYISLAAVMFIVICIIVAGCISTNQGNPTPNTPTPAEVRAIAKEAYIYGFPMVDNYRIERYLRTAFERIEELGGEIVVFGSGGSRAVPEGFPMDEARSQLVEFVTLAGQIAGKHGITIVVEPLHDCNIINTVIEGLDIVRAADHPFVKVLADLYHMDEQNEPVSDILAAGENLAHTHTADTGRLHPGSGSYPHAEFFAALRDIGYEGRVSVECKFLDWDTEPRKALEFLRSMDAATRA